ncbi:MAG: tyrosine-type recombinase/integrase [Acutalibacteraceae bacterium]
MKKATGKRRTNGDGTIYFSESRNRWYAEIMWTDKTGKRNVKKFSSTKQNVVKNKLNEFRKKLLITGGNIDGSKVLFYEFADNWLESTVKNTLKPSSYARKRATLENQVYQKIGNIPISSLTHSDIQEMVNELNADGLSYSSVKKAYECVNGCLRAYRIQSGFLTNPCEGVTLPTNKARDVANISYFNQTERELIEKEAIRRHGNGTYVYRLGYAIVALMYTGLRISELLALKWSDIDFDNNTLTVSKNAVQVKTYADDGSTSYKLITQNSTKTRSGYRVIPMTKKAREAFEAIQVLNGANEYAISTKNNKQVSPRNFNRMFHSILMQTGIAKMEQDCCGVHTLRHTFASMLFQNGCDIKVVSEILGHSDTKITENIYIHVIQQQKVKAIQDIDKFCS